MCASTKTRFSSFIVIHLAWTLISLFYIVFPPPWHIRVMSLRIFSASTSPSWKLFLVKYLMIRVIQLSMLSIIRTSLTFILGLSSVFCITVMFSLDFLVLASFADRLAHIFSSRAHELSWRSQNILTSWGFVASIWPKMAPLFNNLPAWLLLA